MTSFQTVQTKFSHTSYKQPHKPGSHGVSQAKELSVKLGKAQNKMLYKQATCTWISSEFEKSRPLLLLTFFFLLQILMNFSNCIAYSARQRWFFMFSFKILRGKLARGRPVLPYIWLLCCRWLPRTPYDLGLGRRPCKSNFGGAVFQCNTLNRFLHVRKMVKKHMFFFLNYSWIWINFSTSTAEIAQNNVGRCLHRKVLFTKLKAQSPYRKYWAKFPA